MSLRFTDLCSVLPSKPSCRTAVPFGIRLQSFSRRTCRRMRRHARRFFHSGVLQRFHKYVNLRKTPLLFSDVVPPFRKRSRSAFLLGCKRPRRENPTLTTFCGVPVRFPMPLCRTVTPFFVRQSGEAIAFPSRGRWTGEAGTDEVSPLTPPFPALRFRLPRRR